MTDSKKKGSLADQLAGLSISVKEGEAQPESAPEPRPEPEPPRPPSDEELFARAMEEMSDDELTRQVSRKKPDLEKRGAMADALADIKPIESKRRAPSEPPPVSSPGGRTTEDRPRTGERKPVTDEELFAAAVDDLQPQDIYRGKYLGKTDLPEVEEGPSTSDFMRGSSEKAAEPIDEALARESVRDLQNKRALEQALGGVDKRVDSSKFRVKKTKHRPYSTEPNHELTTEPLPKSGPGLHDVELTSAQNELLKRYGKRRRDQHVPELNLRGDTLDDALRRLELFTFQAWKEDRGFVRIIHGKGNQSDGEPVLKPAVLRWLEGPGFRHVRGYAPEVKRAGNYGSLIVELTDRDEGG